MFTVEFQAQIEDGMIKIPQPYNQQLINGKTAKIIILQDDDIQPEIDMIDYLLENPIQVDNLDFLTRDEIYDR